MSATNQTGRVGVGTFAQKPAGVAGDLWYATDINVLLKCVSAGVWTGTAATLLNYQGPAAAITGDSTAKTFYTYTLPGGLLASGKGVRFVGVAKHTTGVVATVFGLTFGGTNLGFGGGISAALNTFSTIKVEVFNNGSVSAQVARAELQDATAATVYHSVTTSSINTASDVIVNATFNVAATDQWTPQMFFAETIN